MRFRFIFILEAKSKNLLTNIQKGTRGIYLKKNPKLVGELLISVSCLDILKYENHAHSHKRNCKDLLKNIKKNQ